jgi:hypothetical protein
MLKENEIIKTVEGQNEIYRCKRKFMEGYR